jgi:FkbM family methyltransferase
LGFNLIRWFTEDQYRAVKRYRWYQDKRLLGSDYPDAVGGIVFDVGGYEGDFALRCVKELNADVYCFEPIPSFQALIKKNFEAVPKAHLRPVGLSDSSRSAKFELRGLGTAEAAVANAVDVELVDVCEALGKDAPNGVDLLALNVEGAEYAILNRLCDTGDISRVRHLRIQFHLTVDHAREQYTELVQRLSVTHQLIWRYPFIWESWSLKS